MTHEPTHTCPLCCKQNLRDIELTQHLRAEHNYHGFWRVSPIGVTLSGAMQLPANSIAKKALKK